MTRQTTILLTSILTLSAWFLTGCGEQELSFLPPNPPTSISSFGERWEKGEQIGVFALDDRGNLVYSNLCYEATDEGKEVGFEPIGKGNEVMIPRNERMKVFAYAPYQPDWQMTGHVFRVQTWSYSANTNNNLRCTSIQEISSASNMAKLSFRHPFSQLRAEISAKADGGYKATDLEGLTAKLIGMSCPVQYDLQTGEISYGDMQDEEILCNVSVNGQQLDIIIPPETKGGHHPQDRQLVIELKKGKKATYPIPKDHVFEAGKSYHWKILLAKDGTPDVEEEKADNSEIL